MAAALSALGFEFARPLGLAGLLVVLAAFLWARRSGSGPLVWTSTAELWARSGGADLDSAARRRLAWPVRLWLLAAVLACVALAGPGAREVGADRTWTVIVDRRAAMHLPLVPGGTSSRLASAVELAQALLAEVRAPGDRLRWRSWTDEGPREVVGDFPSAWLEATLRPCPEPDWSAFDRAGVLFVSDALSGEAARNAGLALSGGQAVPGSVARTAAGDVHFDGTTLTEVPARGAPLRACLDRSAAAPLRRVLEAWADARGVQLVAAPPCELELVATEGGAARGSIAGGHEGWSWRLEGARGDPQGEPWLRDREGLALVAWRPGRIEVLSGWMGEPQGDPAAFAVSWAGLFDAALARPLELASVADRRARGAARTRGPSPPASSGALRPGPTLPWDGVLALLAAGLALVGVSIGWGRRSAAQAALSPSSTSP